jgi:predicted permease
MGLWQDVRFAARLLLKERWFAAAAAVALALGIAVNATVFTLVNAVLLRGLPFEDPDAIMSLGSRDTKDDDLGVSLADFDDWRQARSFEGLALWGNYSFNLSDAGHVPDRFSGAYISANAFTLIRQQPILGRNFRPEDDQPGAPPVLLISHSVWRSRYGGDPAVVGRTVTVNGFLPTIIGVMPEGLQFPNNNDLWVPLIHLPPGVRPLERNARDFQAFGRLADDVSLERAIAELTSISTRLAREYPATNKDVSPVLMTFNERQNGGPIRLIFLSLMGAVGFVLLIACANVANLLLARSAHRAREMSIRVALGASRARVVRQLLVESVMLAAISGVFGHLLATVGVRLFDQATQDVGRPSWIQFTMDGTVFFFIAAVSLGTGILFGLAPALHVSKTDVHDVLKEGGRTGVVGVRARRWTSALIVAEMALTLVLLAGAGFMMRSFLALQRLDLGVDPSRLLTAQLGLPDRKYHEPEERVRFFHQLEERLNAGGAAAGASVASNLPAMGGRTRSLIVDGRAAQADAQLPVVTTVSIGARYFEAIGVTLMRGRVLSNDDGLPGRENVVVNQRFVAMHFPGEEAVGRRIGFAPPTSDPSANSPASSAATAGAAPQPLQTWFTIVGIAPTVRQRNPQAASPDPVVYLPNRFEPALAATVILRTRSALQSPAALAGSMRTELAAIDPDLPLFAIRTMDENIARATWPYTVFGSMFAIFAFIALLLSAVGLYAVTAYSVTQRTQEIGVRMALGAQARQVWWLFMRRMLVLLGVGVSVGLAGAVGVGKLLESFLVGAGPYDPITLTAIAALLAAVATAACFWPAQRATRLDPVAALRYE